MMINCPLYTWFLGFVKEVFPPPKRYRIVEDEDEVGYWFEEIKDEET